MAANAPNELEEMHHHEDESLYQAVDEVEESAVEDEVDETAEATVMEVEQSHHSDGCITAEPDPETSEEPREETEVIPSEGEFASGVSRASSPQPGSSSFAPDTTASTVPHAKFMSIEQALVVDETSSDLSDLPDLSLPPPHGAQAPVPATPSNTHNSLHSVSSSASRHVPPPTQFDPPFPPPLANVSLSEISSVSSSSSESSVQTLGSQQDVMMAARALIQLSRRSRIRRARQCRRELRMYSVRMRRVARWLSESLTAQNRDQDDREWGGSLGSHSNPIVLESQSEDESIS